MTCRVPETALLCYNKQLFPHSDIVTRATYDANGDIILMKDDSSMPDGEAVHVRVVERVKQHSERTTRFAWTLVHEELKQESAIATTIIEPILDAPKAPTKPSAMKRLGEKSKCVLANGAYETQSQFSATARGVATELLDAKKTLESLPARMRGAVKVFWRTANTPVSLPSLTKNGRKPPTKLTLFAVDTVRFGGTFAGIFIVLFVGINYQSFLQIAKAELALNNDLKTQQALEQMVSGKTDAVSTLTDGTIVRHGDNSNLISELPSVGPYEDRIVIPKLGENVPIVRPSIAALMKEDWKQFENDIQSALHDGVVHYPGSARPGQAGNFFLTGHSSYYPWDDGKYKDVFARLNELVPGDTYSVYYGGDRHTYRINGKKEVKPSDVTVLDQPTNKRIATLMTCTPVGTTLRRLIVTAEEIDPATGQILSVGEKVNDDQGGKVARLESLPI